MIKILVSFFLVWTFSLSAYANTNESDEVFKSISLLEPTFNGFDFLIIYNDFNHPEYKYVLENNFRTVTDTVVTTGVLFESNTDITNGSFSVWSAVGSETLTQDAWILERAACLEDPMCSMTTNGLSPGAAVLQAGDESTECAETGLCFQQTFWQSNSTSSTSSSVSSTANSTTTVTTTTTNTAQTRELSVDGSCVGIDCSIVNQRQERSKTDTSVTTETRTEQQIVQETQRQVQESQLRRKRREHWKIDVAPIVGVDWEKGHSVYAQPSKDTHVIAELNKSQLQHRIVPANGNTQYVTEVYHQFSISPGVALELVHTGDDFRRYISPHIGFMPIYGEQARSVKLHDNYNSAKKFNGFKNIQDPAEVLTWTPGDQISSNVTGGVYLGVGFNVHVLGFNFGNIVTGTWNTSVTRLNDQKVLVQLRNLEMKAKSKVASLVGLINLLGMDFSAGDKDKGLENKSFVFDLSNKEGSEAYGYMLDGNIGLVEDLALKSPYVQPGKKVVQQMRGIGLGGSFGLPILANITRDEKHIVGDLKLEVPSEDGSSREIQYAIFSQGKRHQLFGRLTKQQHASFYFAEPVEANSDESVAQFVFEVKRENADKKDLEKIFAVLRSKFGLRKEFNVEVSKLKAGDLHIKFAIDLGPQALKTLMNLDMDFLHTHRAKMIDQYFANNSDAWELCEEAKFSTGNALRDQVHSVNCRDYYQQSSGDGFRNFKYRLEQLKKSTPKTATYYHHLSHLGGSMLSDPFVFQMLFAYLRDQDVRGQLLVRGEHLVSQLKLDDIELSAPSLQYSWKPLIEKQN